MIFHVVKRPVLVDASESRPEALATSVALIYKSLLYKFVVLCISLRQSMLTIYLVVTLWLAELVAVTYVPDTVIVAFAVEACNTVSASAL